MEFPSKKVLARYGVLRLVFLGLALLILGKAVYTMTVKRDYWDKVGKRFERKNFTIEPMRGNILADDGQILAASIPEYVMYMDFMSWEKDTARAHREQAKRDKELEENMDSICLGMHKIFPDIDPVKFKKLLQEGRRRKSHHWQLYPKRISYIEYCEVKKLPVFRRTAGAGGFHCETFSRRKNPYGKLAIRTIGKFKAYADSAESGLELYYDSILSGKPGVAHRQKVMNRYLSFIDTAVVNGSDVQTTLNVKMQDVVEQALEEKLKQFKAEYGLCILMEVKTGDVKAITTLTRQKNGEYADVRNRAVSQLMEPGSVFKPMSFLIAMDDGRMHMDDYVDVVGVKEMYGRKMRDAGWRNGGGGRMDVSKILQKSSNVGVSTLIDREYHSHPEDFIRGLERIGVLEDLHLPVPGYAVPRVLRPSDKAWSAVSLPWLSIGYVAQIPPISTLTFYNGIANNGRMMRPRFVKAVMRNGEVTETFEPQVVREQMAKPEAVRNIQSCLRDVVHFGTGMRASSKYFSVSGKTGTAQVWSTGGFQGQYLVSFAGFFPSESPQYSMIVCMKLGGQAGGATMCAPVFKKIAETIMAQQRTDNYTTARDTVNMLKPMVLAGNNNASARVLRRLSIDFNGEANGEVQEPLWGNAQTDDSGIFLQSIASIENVMPNVCGYGLRDAVYRLEKMGLRVKATGTGHVVAQSIAEGTAFKKGAVVHLELKNGRPHHHHKDQSHGQPMTAPEQKPDSAQTGR